MTSINAIRFNRYQGAMVGDETVTVSNPPTFYAALARDIRDSPNGSRAVGLIHELQRLRRMF